MMFIWNSNMHAGFQLHLRIQWFKTFVAIQVVHVNHRVLRFFFWCLGKEAATLQSSSAMPVSKLSVWGAKGALLMSSLPFGKGTTSVERIGLITSSHTT